MGAAMDWTELRVLTCTEAVEALSERLCSLGAAGVAIEDPADIERGRERGAWDYCDLDAGGPAVVRAYFPIPAKVGGAAGEAARLRRAVKAALEEFRGYGLAVEPAAVSTHPLREDDWANAWKSYFKTLHVGDRLVIVPGWERYEPVPGEIVVSLDPGMAFGTGTHPTTALCLEMLPDLVRPQMPVIDVGTGSGILAIAAARLGAAPVLALDVDPLAVIVAGENARRNGVEAVVEVRQGSLEDGATGLRPGLIVANIIAEVIISLAPGAARMLPAGGAFLASGIIDARLPDVRRAIHQCGLTVQEERRRQGWVALLAGRE